MPIEKVFDAEGNEIGQEVYTQEEIDAMNQEAETKRQSDEEARQKLEADLKKAQEDLLKANDKDKNFSNLRTIKEDLEGKVTNLTNQLTELNQKFSSQEQNKLKDLKESYLLKNNIASKDEKEKFEHFFSKVGVNAKSEEEIQAALKEAHVLATTNKNPDILGTILQTNANETIKNDKAETAASREMRNVLGISDDDVKKYKPKK